MNVPRRLRAFRTILAAGIPLLGFALCLQAQTSGINIACGNPANYTSPDGTVWQSDRYFTGGDRYNSSYGASGTTDTNLYRWSRYGKWGDFSYSIPLTNGSYQVTLDFAELQFGSKGMRVFNVLLNGSPALTNFDIAAEVGPQVALSKQFAVTVANGALQIDVKGVVNFGTLTAIQITPATGQTTPPVTPPVTPPTNTTTPPPTTGLATVLNIVCGNPANYTSPDGTAWLSDRYFTGGDRYNSSYGASGTTDSNLYRWARVGTFGNFSYAIPLANGTYQVTLDFAELQFGSKGVRIFNVVLNGSPALTNFDIVADSGPSVAVSKQFTVAVTNGTLQIDVNSVKNAGLLNAIQIASATGQTTTPPVTPPLTPPTTTPPPTTTTPPDTGTLTGSAVLNIACGNTSNYTSPDGTVWLSDRYFTGGDRYNSSYGASGTTDSNLYRWARLGTWGNFSYSIPLTNGTYQVALKFAEMQFGGKGVRVFNVLLNGSPALTNFDIVADSGPSVAVSKAFSVAVTNGILQIDVQNVVNQGLLNAIQITSGTGGSVLLPPSPTLSLGSSSLTFSGTVGAGNPSAQTVSVSNTGTGTLNWTAAKASSWLTLSATAGTAPSTISMGINAAGLAAGTYTDTVTVSSAGATGSPKTVSVTLNLAASAPAPPTAPGLSLSRTSVGFANVIGAADPAVQSVSIMKTGTAIMNWTAAKTQNWVTLSATSGTAPSTLNIGVVTAGMAIGTYTDTVTVTAPGATGSPATIAVSLIISSNSSNQFYISTTGSSSGDGSINRPWDIITALAHPASVKPGDTIWVRGGTYGAGNTVYRSRLLGTSAAPIIVRQYPGERATINGWLEVGCCDQNPQPSQGGYVWFWGLEFASSILDRTGQPAGPPYYGQSTILDSIDTWAPGSKFINNIIHDTRMGISMWKEAINAESYGNVIYDNGFNSTDRGHGHGFYVQNNTGLMNIADNIIFNNFNMGMQIYGSSATYVRNITVDGNIGFNNGILAGEADRADNILFAGGTGVQGVQLLNNFFYHTPSSNYGYNELGWGSSGNYDIIAKNNYFMGGFQAVAISGWQSAVFQNNKVYSHSKYDLVLNTSNPLSGYSFDNNTYMGSNQFTFNGSTLGFSGYQSVTHLDPNSTFQPGDPTGIWTFVRPNKYEPGRANIVIYNWNLAASVGVDVTGVLTPGTRYEVHDAENFYGPVVASGTYSGSPIQIPMVGLTVAPPHGTVPNVPQHTAPQFGAFVLIPLP